MWTWTHTAQVPSLAASLLRPWWHVIHWVAVSFWLAGQLGKEINVLPLRTHICAQTYILVIWLYCTSVPNGNFILITLYSFFPSQPSEKMAITHLLLCYLYLFYSVTLFNYISVANSSEQSLCQLFTVCKRSISDTPHGRLDSISLIRLPNNCLQDSHRWAIGSDSTCCPRIELPFALAWMHTGPWPLKGSSSPPAWRIRIHQPLICIQYIPGSCT